MTSSEIDPPAARTALVHALVRREDGGLSFIAPVASPALGSLDREADARAELSLYLREVFAKAQPLAIARLSLPESALLVEVDVALLREGLARKPEGDAPVGFACVVLPAEGPRFSRPVPAALSDFLGSLEREDVWVIVPALDHAFRVEEGEALDEAVRSEVRRLVGAQDLSPWELLGLFPGRGARLEVLEVPLPPIDDGGRGAAGRKRAALKKSRREAGELLAQIGTALPVEGHAPPPLTGRDDELGQLRALLSGAERLSVLLVGPEGSGKSALAAAFVATAGRPVFQTSGAELLAGMSGLGQWQERLAQVLAAAELLDAALYFETLDDLLAERTESGGADLVGALRPAMEAGKVRLLAEVRSDRLDALEARHGAFFGSLSRLRVEPLSPALTLAALERRAAHDVEKDPDRPRVAPSALPTLLDLAQRYLPYGSLPGKAVRLYEDLRAARETGGAAPTAPLGKRDLFQVFSLLTGVPEMLLRDDAPLRIDEVSAALRRYVVGQELAVKSLAETIAVVKAGLQPTGKPLATFLFVGPTGVGKTELARALAAFLFGSPDRLARFDMSEFQTPDAAERLIRGTDRDDGLLTRRVREQPFGVVLLDEIEKAHPAVFDLLLQVAGEGRLTDARGHVAWFHNTILIMTSNLGAADKRSAAGFGERHDPASEAAHYQRAAASAFRKEFHNRLDRVVPFAMLTRAEVHEVARLAVQKLRRRRGLDESGNTLTLTPAALARFADDGYSAVYGARALRRHLDEHLASPLAGLLGGIQGASDLAITLSLAGEEVEPVEGAGPAFAELSARGFRWEVRGSPAGKKGAPGGARIFHERRRADGYMRLAPIEELRDHVDFLVTQLAELQGEERDGRVARELGELGSEHHRLSSLWQKLSQAQEEIHAVEELAVVGLLEGHDPSPLHADLEAALRSMEAALPYALVALEPHRDEITLLLEQLDPEAIADYLRPLFPVLAKREWTVVGHLEGGKGAGWRADRPFGPPLDERALRLALTHPDKGFRCLVLRVRGPYAGVFLALEAGLHRAFRGAEGGRTEIRMLRVTTLSLRFDVPDEVWDTDVIKPPPAATADVRRRGNSVRAVHEATDKIMVLGKDVRLARSDYFARFEKLALEHLLLFEAENDPLDRDDFFSPGHGS